MNKLWVIITCFTLTLLSCYRESVESDKITIGFSASTEVFLQERWKRDLSIFTAHANEHNAEVILFKSARGSNNQLEEIKALIREDLDVLVIIPRDRENLTEVVAKVMGRGVPVLAYDRLILDTFISGYISFDNQEVGMHMGRTLLEHVPKGRYFVINGSVMDNNSYEVNLGLNKILRPQVIEGNIEIVDSIWLEEWSYDEAFKRFNTLLDRYGTDIDAVSCANDMIAQAVIKVLAERRLAGSVVVVGQDADLTACQSIVEGTQTMTVYKPLHNIAVRAADIALSLAVGEIPEPDLYINNNSNRYIPYYIERTIPVTRKNIEETVLKDGFHPFNDVIRE